MAGDVVHQHLVHLRGRDDARREQEHRFGVRDLRQPLGQARGVDLRVGAAEAAEDLDDVRGRALGQRTHHLDGLEQRFAPRRDADDLARRHDAFEIGGGAGAECRDDVFVGEVRGVDDDELDAAEFALQFVFDVREDTGGNVHRGADDAVLGGELEHARDARLRDAQELRDFRLGPVLLVIKARDLRRESQLLMRIVVMDSHACPRFGLDGKQFYVTRRVLNLLRREEYTDTRKTLLRKIERSRPG